MIYPNPELKKIILERNQIREDRLSDFATKSKNAIRRKIEGSDNIRLNYARDTDRIIHSMCYSRYLGKTQVYFQVGNDHITRRALHVQLVAKIARTISRFLNTNDDLVEAIALAHDIGHTPFGHTGEDILADCMENCGAGSFLHSAQSVRMLDKIENEGKGLNLSLAVLDGVLGHNGEILQNEISFNPANLNFETLDYNVAKCLGSPREEKCEKRVYPSTLEGCIVRVSDMIAYIGRDLEDSITLGVLKREELPDEAVKILGNNNKEIVNNLCTDIMNNSFDGKAIRFSDKVFTALTTLKRFSIEKIYLHPQKVEQVRRFTPMLELMFKQFIKDVDAEDKESIIYKCFLKSISKDYFESTPTARKVADFIAAMTDDFFLTTYNNIFIPAKIDYGEKFKTE